MIAKPVLIDTGPIVALLSDRDQHRDACIEQARDLGFPACTCWPVITEAAYLLRSEPDVVAALLSKCDGSRFEILPLGAADLPAICAILERYRDQHFQLADACLMYLAEREGIDFVFTVDKKDFLVFRTAAGKSLQVIPP